MQYTKKDEHEVLRFVENGLISWMVDQIGLNKLCMIAVGAHEARTNEGDVIKCDIDDYDQLLQLTGYSISGIPYRGKEKYEITDDDQHRNPEVIFEELYKKLKKDIAPIVSDLFNLSEEDLT